MCLHKVHIRCNCITIDEYKLRLERNNDNPDKINAENWTSLQCKISERANISPFGYENSYELNCINIIDSMKQIVMIPEFEIVSEAMKANNIANNIDEQSIYNSCEEFSKLSNNNNSFDLFHSNVNGNECHADNLKVTLINSSIDFNVVCLSETSLKIDETFPDNVKLQNFAEPFLTNKYKRH